MKNFTFSFSSLKFASFLFLISILINNSVDGAVKTWTAAGGGSWIVAANWSGGTIPVANDDVVFTNAGAIAVTAVPTITLNSIAKSGAGVVTFTSTGASVISINNSVAAIDLSITAGGVTVSTNLSITMLGGSVTTVAVGANLTTGAARVFTLTSLAGTVANINGTFSDGGILTLGALSVMTINGTMNNNTAGAFTTSTTSLIFSNGSSYNHNGTGGVVPTATWNNTSNCNIIGTVATYPTGLNQTFGHFNWNCASQTITTATLTGNMTINGDFFLNAGTFHDGGFTVTGNASGIFIVGAGTTYTTTRTATPWFPTLYPNANISLDPSSNFNFNGNANFTIPSAQVIDYGILGIGVGGIKTLSANITAAALNITAGTFADGGFSITSFTGSQTMTIASGATFQIGTAAFASTFPTSFITYNLNPASTVVYNSNAVQAISNVPTYGNLTLTATSAVTKTPTGGSLAVAGTFTIGLNNTFDLAGFDILLSGGYANNGTMKANAAGSIVDFVGSAAAQTFTTNTGTYTGNLISNLVIDNSNAAGVSLGTQSATLGFTNVTITAARVFNLAAQTIRIAGTFTNLGTLTANAAGSTIMLNGSAAQTFTIGTYTSSVLAGFTINNAAGVTLNSPLSVTTLTLTSGLLNTLTNLLTVVGTTPANIPAPGAGSYIKGPLARTLPASLSGSNTFLFPVGKTAYKLFQLINPTTNAGGTVVIKTEVFDANAGGSSGPGVGVLNTTRYWSSIITSGAANLTSTGRIALDETAPAPVNLTDHVCYSTTQSGVYAIYQSTVAGSTVTTVNSGPVALGFFVIGKGGNLSGTYTVGTTGQFFSLTNGGGLFETINSGTVTGNITANIVTDLLIETGGAALNQWIENPVASNFTLTMQSSAAVQRLISASYNGGAISTNGLIRFDGADRVTVNGGTGAQRFLLFRNTNTTAAGQTATFQLLNDATNNYFNNCIIEGSCVTNSNGVFVFGTTTGTTGNDNNTITLCDIHDCTSPVNTPDNCIYGLGNATAGKENSGNTISNCSISNFWHATSDCNGISLQGGNTGWTITGNSFFQTSTRAMASEMDGVQIANTSGNGFVITGNYVGGQAANAGGAALTLTGNAVFRGLRFSVGSTTATSIQGNFVQNISITTTNASTAQAGISMATGSFNCGDITPNNIGSQSATGNILFSCSVASSVFSGIQAGTGTPGTIVISNNTIGGITVSGAGGTSLRGINTQGTAASYTISGNTIGSTTIASSLNNSSNSTLFGILSSATTSSPTTTVNSISGNTVVNLSSTGGANAAGQVVGISITGGVNNVSTNTVRILSNTNPDVGTNGTSSVIGILSTSSVVATPQLQTITQNTIHTLSNSNAGAVGVIGICVSPNVNTGASLLSRNFIHSFSTTSTTAFQQGINSSTSGTATGVATIQNNMIRLGIDAAGAAITSSVSIIGINKNIGANSNIIFNSVYIGGSAVVSGAVNTAAFQRLLTGTDEIRDNIFVNARSNASGTGVHFAYSLNAITTATSDYNIYYAAGTGGAVSSVAGTSYTLQGLRFTVTSQDLHSGVGDPNFITPLGTSATINLHLNNATPAEGTGVTTTATVTDDFDGTTRSTVSPIDIGADAGNFNALVAGTDIFTPIISYTALSNQAACATSITFTATVTDVGVGIPTSGLDVPRVYYRRSLPSATAWTSTAGVYVSGTAFSSVWSFTISSTPVLGETYQYYVVAQDLATNPANPNIWFSKFDATTPSFTNNNVNSPIAHPTNPDSYTIVTSLSGTVYVGVGAGTPVYNTFNGAAGLFAAINSGVLSSDLTVIVQNNVTEITTTPLNQFGSTCGGPYKITIQPDAATLRIISGSLISALIQFNGADSVTVNGNFSGAGRYLRFQNQNGGTGVNIAPTFYLTNDSRRIIIKNTEVEGFTSNASSGVVFIGAGTTTGNDYFTLDNCIVHEKTNVFGGYPLKLIYSNGTSLAASDNISITNNNLYNFSAFGASGTITTAYAMDVTANGNGSNWTITGNSIYNTFIDGTAPQNGIRFLPGASSNNNVISTNYIGGNNPLCVGSGGNPYWANNYDDGFSSNNELDIVTLNCGTVNLTGNTIKRIRNTNSDNSGLVVFWIQGSTTPTFTSNTIGDVGGAIADQVVAYGGGLSFSIYPGYIYGIFSTTSGAVTVNQNNFYYLAQLGAYTGGGSYTIYHSGSGTISVTNNNIIGSQASGIGYDSYGIEIIPSATISGVQINNNIIDGPYILDNAGPFVTTTAIFVNGTNLSGTINNNRVYDMRNNSPDGQVEGIWLNGTGNWTLKNNQVSLGNYSSVTPTNNLGIFGIEDDLSNAVASSVTAYYNTVIIGGTQATGTNTFDNSMSFVRQPGQTGTVIGDVTTLKNNIFINNRTGGTTSKHYAIVNYGTSNFATNWNAAASNYNFIASNNAATLGIWGTTDQSFTNWKTASSGDANSWNVNTVSAGASTATQLNPTDLFTSITLGNLNINPANQALWFVNGKGVAGAISGSINSDYGGGTRGTTFGYATDLGADEFNANTGVYPFALTATPALSGTNIFTFAGRQVGSITWGASGTVPTSVSFEYFSGDVPGTNPTPTFPGGYNNADFTYHITATGGSGYTYDVSLNYDDADKGDFAVAPEGNMMLIKTNPTNNWITRSTTINTVTNIFTSSGLTDFSYFTGSDGTILPIQLSSFTVENYEAVNALLKWTTASELNNNYFECEVATVTDNSGNLIFRKLGEVAGNGTSVIAHQYQFIDTESGKTGIRYYRVKQVDFDGQYTYTLIKQLKFANPEFVIGEIFPNPTFDWINISINQNDLKDLHFKISSLDGRMIDLKTILFKQSENGLTIDVSTLTAGIYFIQFYNSSNSINELKRFIKMK